MDVFRKEKAPPPPGEQGSNHEAASLPKSKRTRVMGVMQKVNPFKASSQTADSSELRKDSSQNPGMISSVIQKVNPFKSWHSKDAQPPQVDASSGRESRTDSDDLSDEPPTSSPRSVRYVDDVGSAEPKSPANERPKTRKKTFTIQRILPTALLSSGSKVRAERSASLALLSRASFNKSCSWGLTGICILGFRLNATEESIRLKAAARSNVPIVSPFLLFDSRSTFASPHSTLFDGGRCFSSKPCVGRRRRSERRRWSTRLSSTTPAASRTLWRMKTDSWRGGERLTAGPSGTRPPATTSLKKPELAQRAALTPAVWPSGRQGGGRSGGPRVHGGAPVRRPVGPARRLAPAARPVAPDPGRRRRRLPQEDGVGQRGRRCGRRGRLRHHHHRTRAGAVHGRNVAHRHGRGHRRGHGRRRDLGLGQHHGHGALQDGPQESGENDPGLPGGDERHQGLSGVLTGRDGDSGGVEL
ncbi:uncharacterized protein LOC133472456 isoform X10 [Phyllopteryx taeniolatus]|uniref:uncharacterized protein LOC133472456 isoform X10 n=1 Tax=Phyllopteryx taeniolatus TaxID=161469 RepID=UPI002AD2D8B3|nr:uncharacterized protein LOC133472456 isoform X10 [Phyllopteryx taeniolatus]